MSPIWQTTRFAIDLRRPQVMGIVNATPDSFSDGGQHADTAAALRHCEQLLREGADILDIGGESTRPGSPAVPLEQERERVIPILREAVRLGVPVSVDTYKPEVMRAALAAGAAMINDIYALRMPGAVEAVADADCAICLMHMQGEPLTMQQAPVYGDVVAEVRDFLAGRVAALAAAGIARERIVLDPGFGFGKTTAHNLQLLAQLERFTELGVPVLAGLSRKRTIGELTGRSEPRERVAGSVAAHLVAAQQGALLLRVHDVAAMVDALKVWNAVAAVPAPRKAVPPEIVWPE